MFNHCTKTNNEPENKKPRNIKKNQDCTPQGGSSGRELGLVILFLVLFFWFLGFCFFLCFWILVLFNHCTRANSEPENNKPRNPPPKKTKPKKQKNTKKMIAHPKGGVVAESWVLSCFFGFVFFFDFGFV